MLLQVITYVRPSKRAKLSPRASEMEIFIKNSSTLDRQTTKKEEPTEKGIWTMRSEW